MKAQDHMMVTVHSGDQAKYYYEQLPTVMQSVFIRNVEEYESFVGSGVPFRNIIAYVGQTINEKNIELVNKLHEQNVRCMISFAPSLDKLPDEESRKTAYQKELPAKPHIVESDYPLEVWEVLQAR